MSGPREIQEPVRFPACSCGVVPCTVLDPFGGSGTVGQVARQLGRRAILIELKEEYARMAEARVNSLEVAGEERDVRGMRPIEDFSGKENAHTY